MNLDRVIISTGMAVIDGPMTDEAKAVLMQYCVALRRAGVVITLSEWETLTQETRAAFLAAGSLMYEHMASPAATEVPAASP